MTRVSLILAFLFLASSFIVASKGVAEINASEPPPLVGVPVSIYSNGSVRYVSSLDYFYVSHGFLVGNWSTLPSDVQSAFLDPQQNYFTLQTNAPNFENPPMGQFTEYYADYAWPPYTDVMVSMFFFQFHPGDLAPGNYSFTGTWSSTALANPPDYVAYQHQSHVTLVVVTSMVTSVPVGENVTVDPTGDLELTFTNVTIEGYVTTNKTSTVEAPLLVDLVGQYCDISVTASYFGKIMISLTYDDMNLTQQRESALQMVQYTPIDGDIIGYGKVDIVDIATMAKSFGATPDSPRWNADADIDGNGNVNIVDISRCAKNFGKTTEWTNITTFVDTELNIVRGETTHFSFIGIH